MFLSSTRYTILTMQKYHDVLTQEPKSEFDEDVFNLIEVDGWIDASPFKKPLTPPGSPSTERRPSVMVNYSLGPTATSPTQAYEGQGAGWDLYLAKTKTPTVVYAKYQIYTTKLYLEIPEGYYGQIKNRSCSVKENFEVFEGVVDSDYRGEIFLYIRCRENASTILPTGGRAVAQIIFLPVANVKMCEKRKLTPTERGDGKEGSSNASETTAEALAKKETKKQKL